MSYKKDLSNNIFDFQSHFKMTAAFIVNKLSFCYNNFDLYIHKTYLHFLRKHLQTFDFCILTSNQFWKIHRNHLCQGIFFIKVTWKIDSGTADFLKLCKNFTNTFYRTPLGDRLCRPWREVVLLITNFKECSEYEIWNI